MTSDIRAKNLKKQNRACLLVKLENSHAPWSPLGLETRMEAAKNVKALLHVDF